MGIKIKNLTTDKSGLSLAGNDLHALLRSATSQLVGRFLASEFDPLTAFCRERPILAFLNNGYLFEGESNKLQWRDRSGISPDSLF